MNEELTRTKANGKPRIVVSPADHGSLKLWLDERTYTLPRCRDYAVMPERDAEKLRDQLKANGVLAVLVKMPESVDAGILAPQNK